ncbi:major facilitator superfamily domain-containing protein [Aspergillus pseudodeflectus]|uniref:Major facilitator superfamily domain-containing protein n=1 Tax=Aspergillus pseudodeflectus TaxID=176178 RepID=A0ABR4KSI8_9EURO
MSLLQAPSTKNPSRESIQEQPRDANSQDRARSLSPSPNQDDLESGDDVDIAEIERIYRKIDLRIIPAFWTLYFLCSAIRSNIGLAQTMNIETHHTLGEVLNISQHEISTGLALFYVCYVVFDLPSNLIMTKLSPHVWMSRIVIGVGIIGSCMAAMEAAWSLYLLRLLLGIVIAGMWPGMAYYLTLFYPPSRTGKRIGQYYTAAQLSAAVVGLVSAGFQKMDGARGLVGFQWMFLVYGVITVAVGIALLWWLPDRPKPPAGVEQGQGEEEQEGEGYGQGGEGGSKTKLTKYLPFRLPQSRPVLTGRDAEIHYRDLTRVYKRPRWTVRNLLAVLLDWRLWPLLIMYFGVVGVGIGVQNYATVIIHSINPSLSGISLSLLTAPIWLMDLLAILLLTPLSDRFHHSRPAFFILGAALQITGLLITTFTGTSDNPWPRYGGLLIIGFGLGPTVPTTMAWTTEIFQPRHGEVGVAAASAVVSGWGNLGSILTTYALYQGWEADAAAAGREKFRKSNLVMVGILGGSILAALGMWGAVRLFPGKSGDGVDGEGEDRHGKIVDGAARRELEQRGFEGLGRGFTGFFKRDKQ